MSDQIFGLLYTNRLLRIYKVVQYFMDLETTMEANIKFARIAKYIFIHFVFYYWWACLVYTVACFKPTCDPNSWPVTNPHIAETLNFKKHPMEYTLYYVLGTQLVSNNPTAAYKFHGYSRKLKVFSIR